MALPTRLGLVLVAAGEGTRLGAGVPKAFAPLAGEPLLRTALRAVAAMASPVQLALVVPADRLAEAQALAAEAVPDGSALVVAGGPSRPASVAAGLGALPATVEVVLVHDAARALTPPELFDEVARLVDHHGAGVVPSLPVHDTVQQLDAEGAVVATPDRGSLVLAQTPQGFPRELLEAAYRVIDAAGHTDDASIVRAAGHRVIAVPGSELAFKITRPADLRRAEALLAADGAAAPGWRTGVGVDAHRLEPGVPLMLGGLAWPGEPAGLAGHSDGDAVCHAIVDALLSAAGLGDIGTVFGTADPAMAGAAGTRFLQETAALLAEAGWRIRNVAVEVVGNHPRIGPRRAEIERVLSDRLGAPVAVAATTTDGLGLTGEGRGIGAIATALIVRR